MQTAPQSTDYTHTATLNGETVYCNAETFREACDALVAKHGGGIPDIKQISNIPVQVCVNTSEPSTLEPIATTPALEAGVSQSGKARAEQDEQTALDNGFAPKPPVYSMGTRVVQMGVDNARQSQLEHDAKPSAREVCLSLIETVKNEHRVDLPAINVCDLRMTSKGMLALPDDKRIAITGRTFAGLMGRFDCNSGVAYLNSCPTKLRSINFNHWATETGVREMGSEQTTTVLRTRTVNGKASAFTAVSESYTPFDADKIAEALHLAFPPDAKGVLDYDGERFRIEGMYHTDVAPEEFVAGEIFKAGVIVRSDDTGGGSVRVQSVIWRNLCLNLLILDKNIGIDIRIRHMGSVHKLAFQFKQAFNKALHSVDAFANAWSSARREQGEVLKALVQGTTRDNLSLLPIEAVLPGIFTGILERELVPMKGRTKSLVPQLLEMHSQDEAAAQYGVSRASIVNSFTRYAHTVETDPFRADEIRAGAGALLSSHNGRAPAPLPYVAPTGL